MGNGDTRTTCLSTLRSESSGTNVHANQTGKLNPINCFSLWNCRGLKPRTVPSKVPYIQDLVREQDQLFIVLTETWLRDHSDAELDIGGYTLFRQDRKRQRKKRGRDSGGVAVYMKNDLAADMVVYLDYIPKQIIYSSW